MWRSGSSSTTATSTSLSLPSLLCEEDQSCFNLYDDGDENLPHCCIAEHNDEFLERLIDKEASYLMQNDRESNYFLFNVEEVLPISARLDAVEWILNTRTSFGFHKKTAYLSLLYFDRFLSKRSVSGFKESVERGKSWSVRLLSVACLSLAAKMEEYRAPGLSEYHKICTDEYHFQVGVVQRMELLVLKTLGWRMNLITPFDYFCYFIAKFCDDSKPKGLTTRAIELTLATLKEITFVQYPSSIIAAAAILAACDDQLSKKLIELKIREIPSWKSHQKDRISSCYKLMQKIQRTKSRTPNLETSILNLPLKRPNSNSETEANDCAETCETIGHKRKRMGQ